MEEGNQIYGGDLRRTTGRFEVKSQHVDVTAAEFALALLNLEVWLNTVVAGDVYERFKVGVRFHVNSPEQP